MEILECPSCQRNTGFKRALGFGTFFMVLITFGFWILAIPFYPLRCSICGNKHEGFAGLSRVQILVAALGVVAFISVLVNRGYTPTSGYSPTSRPVSVVQAPEYNESAFKPPKPPPVLTYDGNDPQEQALYSVNLGLQQLKYPSNFLFVRRNGNIFIFDASRMPHENAIQFVTHDAPAVLDSDLRRELISAGFVSVNFVYNDQQATYQLVYPHTEAAAVSEGAVAETSDSKSASQESVEGAVTNWVNAFRERNATALADCYAPTVETYFLRSDVSHNQILHWVEDAFRRTIDIRQYEISGIQIEVLPSNWSSTDSVQSTRATATFNKKWETTQTDGKTFSGEEIERLTFASSSLGWKIVREEELKILRASRR